MIHKRIGFIFGFLLCANLIFGQQHDKTTRIKNITEKLDSLKTHITGLSKTVDFNVSNIELPSFIRAVASTHKVNITVAPQLKTIVLTHNFSNAAVKDVIVYLCKEYDLTLDLVGNIISLKKHIAPVEKTVYIPRNIPIKYHAEQDLFSIDLKNDSLAVAFKKITDATGKNLVFSPGLGSKKISGYIKEKPFESAIDKLAFSNNLLVTKTKDDYYLFESDQVAGASNLKNQKAVKPRRYSSSSFYFKVKDSINQILEVDFENAAIENIIKDIGLALNINMFTTSPLSKAGNASAKANNITFDVLLEKVLEDSPYTFKKKEGIYYFGNNNQSTLRNSVIIPLLHRSIQIMNEPIQSNKNRGFANNNSGFINNNAGFTNNNGTLGTINNTQDYRQNTTGSSNPNNRRNINTSNTNTFGNYQSKSEALVNILPKEITDDLDIKTDIELNSFIVSGDAQKIQKFKNFLKTIDKPIPVILIEVMILEVSNSATVSTGVELGLGNEPVNDAGGIFPNTDLTIGATTINKIIGDFNGFGSLNVGKVVPNFYAKIQALETNGNVKIRSTPKLSTLNGHQATLSNGERSYYAVIRRDIIGSQNPQTTEIKNYVPIDADLSIAIKPIVSGDGQITMSINVVQSSFNGERLDSEAPPGINSREFTSTIRVRDQDVVILGGLEENVKSDSGSGVPFLARIPIIKWFFSKKTRTDSKTKLSVLIKPTIIK